jgi:hypothetical protein
MRSPIKLEFSEKYDKDHAREYFSSTRTAWRDGFPTSETSSWRARPGIGRRAWPGPGPAVRCRAFLAAAGGKAQPGDHRRRQFREAMIETACAAQPPEVVARVRPLQTSAFAIDLPDNSVDSIFCMRLFHHIGESAHRKTILSNFNGLAVTV